MKNGVKSIIFFLVTLIVGALAMISIQNPSLLGTYLDKILLFFTSIEINNINSFVLVISASLAIILLILLIIFGIKRKKKKRKMKKRRRRRTNKKVEESKKASTKLDLLYMNIKNNEKTNILEISKKFGVSKEKALEWSKMLEKGDLVKVSYPTFKSPVISLKKEEKKESDEEDEKKSSGKDSNNKKDKKEGKKKEKKEKPKKKKDKKSKDKKKKKSKKRKKKPKSSKNKKSKKKSSKSKKSKTKNKGNIFSRLINQIRGK